MIEFHSVRDHPIRNGLCALLALFLASTLPAAAARIEVERSGETATVTVRGTLESGDGQRFNDAVANVPKAIVMLNSNGGDLDSGLTIGRTIRRKSYTTAVPNGVRCASACALAWLGGATRFMGESARIGFHAAYVDGRSGPRESGVGNALVGAYLNGHGLAEKAVIYLTSTPPDDIQWLTMEDARKLEISVALLAPRPGERPAPPDRTTPPDRTAQPNRTPPPDRTTPPKRTAQPNRPGQPERIVDPRVPGRTTVPIESDPPFRRSNQDEDRPPVPARRPAPNVSLKQQAETFIAEHFDHWSDMDPRALSYTKTLYADSVDFFGKATSRQSIVDMKKQFIERWPLRVYTLRTNSVEIACDQGPSTCVITGQVDWETSDVRRGARSTGLSDFIIGVSFSGANAAQVFREGGQVISRTGAQ